MRSYSYLSLSSGGSYGIMYLGFIRALRSQLVQNGRTLSDFINNLRGIAGVSVGALMALAINLNLTDSLYDEYFTSVVDEMSGIMTDVDFANLIQSFGLNRGTVLRNMVIRVLQLSGISSSVTFGQLQRLMKRDYVCVATNLRTQSPLVLSASTTPDLSVVDGVYMSMCIPFLFQPLRYHDDHIVDGCLMQQMPRIFDPSETLHVNIIIPKEQRNIRAIQDFCMACGCVQKRETWFEAHDHIMLRNFEACTHYPCEFTISASTIDRMRAHGYACTMIFFDPSVLEVLMTLVVTLVRNASG